MEGKSVRAHYTRTKSTIDAPSSRRQSVTIVAPRIKEKSAIETPRMKGKSVDLPKEGKSGKNSISINFSREKLGD